MKGAKGFSKTLKRGKSNPKLCDSAQGDITPSETEMTSPGAGAAPGMCFTAAADLEGKVFVLRKLLPRSASSPGSFLALRSTALRPVAVPPVRAVLWGCSGRELVLVLVLIFPHMLGWGFLKVT